AAASAITRSVTCTMVASSCSTAGTVAEATNSSGDAAASVRAMRSSRPGARSSRWATSSSGRPARRATAATNSLSITSHSSWAATSRATSEPPDAYCRVTVMTGGAISGLQVLAEVPDVEQRQPALGRHEDDQVVRALHVVQRLDPLLGEGLGGERLIEEALLLHLEPSDLDAVPLGLDLLLLRDLVVDRLDHLGGRLQIAEEKRRDGRDPELAAARARGGDERRVDEPFHGIRDLGALGDVVDGVLYHAVAHAFADGVEHGAANLVLVPDLGEDLRRLLRVNLPADRHLDMHSHLLARERLDRFDLLAACGPLLLARRVALDRRPRGHEPDARQEWRLLHVPEGVPHAHLTGVDDHGEGADTDHEADRSDPESDETQQVGDGPGTLRAEAGRREEEEEGDAEEDRAGDELTHGNSSKGRGEDAPHAPLRKEVRSAPSRSGLPVSGPLGLGAGPHVAELLVARDPFLGYQSLEHQLGRGDHGTRILFPCEAHLIDEVEQAGDHAEPLEARLGPLLHGELERSTLVEPMDDVVHVGAAHASFEGLPSRPP